MRQRLAQFAWKAPVELTRASTFVEKARLFPGDDRLSSVRIMHMALEEIANSGASLLVAVRLDAAGRLRALSDIPMPRRYADIFTEIPEHRFRFDISSSEIRGRRRSDGGRAP
jgi:hypothetical protein